MILQKRWLSQRMKSFQNCQASGLWLNPITQTLRFFWMVKILIYAFYYDGYTKELYVAGATHYFFSNGRSKFQHLYTKDRDAIFVLSSNASVWYQKTLRRNGTLVQVDHRDKSTGVKFSRVMQCNKMPKDKQEEDQTCSTLYVQVSFYPYLHWNSINSVILQEGTNFLNDGLEWNIISTNYFLRNWLVKLINNKIIWAQWKFENILTKANLIRNKRVKTEIFRTRGLDDKHEVYVRSHGRLGVFAKYDRKLAP